MIHASTSLRRFDGNHSSDMKSSLIGPTTYIFWDEELERVFRIEKPIRGILACNLELRWLAMSAWEMLEARACELELACRRVRQAGGGVRAYLDRRDGTAKRRAGHV
jgi:hypothetical protein